MNFEEKVLAMLAAMQSEMGAMRSDIAKLSTGQAEFKEEVNKRFDSIEAQLKELDERSLKSAVLLETDVPRDINRLYEARSEMKQKLDTLATKEQVEELADEVHVIRDVVSGHSRDIGRLKKAQ